MHAFTHPKEALRQALTITELNDKEQDIIKNHMWPVTPKFPRYKETYIITLVDKYSAVAEALIGKKIKIIKVLKESIAR